MIYIDYGWTLNVSTLLHTVMSCMCDTGKVPLARACVQQYGLLMVWLVCTCGITFGCYNCASESYSHVVHCTNKIEIQSASKPAIYSIIQNLTTPYTAYNCTILYIYSVLIE